RARRLRTAESLPRLRHPRGDNAPAGAAELSGHAGAGGDDRPLPEARPAAARLSDRRPWHLRLGPRPQGSRPPPRSLRIPARLRARPLEPAPMSRLRIFNDADPSTVMTETRDHALIAELLGREGVRFERWAANAPVQP